MDEKFCPILMIGFEPPENDKTPDPRVCNPGCMWYDELEKDCTLKVLNNNILELIDYTCAASMGMPSDTYEGF